MYCTYDYLRSTAQGTRAEMLLEFIDALNEIQNDFPWYFQSISGINNLLQIKPDQGYRLKNAQVTIKMIDSIDQRVRYLLSLYRRIVWDDVYQRWALPDMMRFFKMYIYISEIRDFHAPSEPDYELPEEDKKENPFDTNVIMKRRQMDDNKSGWSKIGNEIYNGVGDIVNGTFGHINDKLKNNKINFGSKAGASSVRLLLNAIDSVSPVTMIECDMCDIDL